jgi:hypothetical protein
MAEPKWKRFEKVIHQLHAQLAPEGAIVTHDDKIVGQDSKTERQLDITIRITVTHYRLLIVIECKDEARPVDVGEIGAFASVLRDVKANKGVMISSAGYTEPAIEMARSYGIDTRTYLDTESVDWKSEVAIPMLLTQVNLESWQVNFSSVPGFQMAIPTDIQFPFIETFAPDGTPLGPIITLLGKKWHGEDESLFEPGQHVVPLSDHVILKVGDREGHAKIDAHIIVSRSYYLGPLPVQMVGFRNEQDGSLTTNKLTTGAIEPSAIEKGLVPGWVKLTSTEEIAISVMLRLVCHSALPQSAVEMEEMYTSTGPKQP